MKLNFKIITTIIILLLFTAALNLPNMKTEPDKNEIISSWLPEEAEKASAIIELNRDLLTDIVNYLRENPHNTLESALVVNKDMSSLEYRAKAAGIVFAETFENGFISIQTKHKYSNEFLLVTGITPNLEEKSKSFFEKECDLQTNLGTCMFKEFDEWIIFYFLWPQLN